MFLVTGELDSPKCQVNKNIFQTMDTLKGLSFEEAKQINGGGPISQWVCGRVKDFREWVRNYEPSSSYTYLDYKMAGL